MEVTIQKPKKCRMTEYLLDKWAVLGFGGMLLNIVSLIADAELPDLTGFSGLLIIVVAVYQKVRDDRRKQEKHVRKMQLYDKIISGELKVKQDFLKELFDDN